MKKQTTIYLEIEEDICGATVTPRTRRIGDYQAPTEQHMLAWRGISPDPWGPKNVTPKDGAPDDKDWWVEFGQRLLRVCINRPRYATKARVIKTFPGGTPRMIALTTYWQRPKPEPRGETPGIWTLKEHRSGRDTRGRIIGQIRASLECLGDELYCHLPDGDVPEGYDTFPDVGDIMVAPLLWSATDARVWWSFRFHKTRAPKS